MTVYGRFHDKYPSPKANQCNNEERSDMDMYLSEIKLSCLILSYLNAIYCYHGYSWVSKSPVRMCWDGNMKNSVHLFVQDPHTTNINEDNSSF